MAIIHDFPDLSDLVQEATGLEALEYQMARNLDELRLQRDMAKLSASFKGKLLNLAGRLFTVYCIVRIISVSPSLSAFHMV
jgi:hypothetical protein